MSCFNRVILVGNITRDPELRHVGANKMALCDLGLAVNDRVKRNGEWTDETTFVDVTLWARTAEIANEYLGKGDSVLIEGRLKLDQWEANGEKRSKLKVVGEKLQMLGSRNGKKKNTAHSKSDDDGGQPVGAGADGLDHGQDIPF